MYCTYICTYIHTYGYSQNPQPHFIKYIFPQPYLSICELRGAKSIILSESQAPLFAHVVVLEVNYAPKPASQGGFQPSKFCFMPPTRPLPSPFGKAAKPQSFFFFFK